jgi:hypothetical protein
MEVREAGLPLLKLEPNEVIEVEEGGRGLVGPNPASEKELPND